MAASRSITQGAGSTRVADPASRRAGWFVGPEPPRFPGRRSSGTGATRHSAPLLVRRVNVAAKTALLLMLAFVVANPDYGNLEGKAPVARAVTYPLLAFALLAFWWVRARTRAPYPWVADLLVTLTCFTDILGNRLDLYDSIVWFDDWIHFMNSGLLSAAALLLTTSPTSSQEAVLERAVAFGVTASLAWEVFEYVSFMTNSPERPMAYTDTLGDLTLGWLGACVAAFGIHAIWRLGPSTR